ncbi:uncharacterized protein N7518_001735 [Penicillium psychrosexuale]|uniref:uncharacterized protein n=1 Tax=Penicillium psychrosexuale TaxID=1002107 RepID=UPI0025455FFB|nr:uncharacterized protein N7518_001735 [Penicillium psychrosexuale]KAJ5799667.1 hypothetical protein N7518_001735 [Penicillium psychrosexuale]
MTSTAGGSPPSNVRSTPEQYTKSIHQACMKSLQTDLFSSAHYQFLSDFLKSTSRHDLPARSPGLGAEAPSLRSQDRFTYVVVHTIANGAIKRHCFDHKTGLEDIWKFPDVQPGTDQIVFVRGSLSPAWVGVLGAKYQIDPEFFRRHLRYLSQNDFSDLPSLPSASTNTISLPVTSLYTRSFALRQDQVRRRRREDYDVARSNQQAIRQSASTGESIIRKVSTLTDRLVSVEHDISIYTKETVNGCRLAFVLLDNGLNLNRPDGPPCFSRHDSLFKNTTSSNLSLNPILIPRPDTIHTGVAHPVIPGHDRDHANLNSFCHVASLLPFHFGMSLSERHISPTPRPTRPSIMLLLKEVFILVAGSECQFLNRVHSVVKEEQRNPGDERQMELALNTLVYIKTLLDEHRSRLQGIITFLGRCSSPDSDSDIARRDSCAAATARSVPQGEMMGIIYGDFEELLSRNKSLGEFCVGSMDLIMNNAMLKESRKAVETADDQKRLTILAYFFLPLSLATSIFGMNVQEFGTGNQHIWLPVVTLAVIVLVAMILLNPHYFKSCWSKFVKRRQPEIPTYQTQGATMLFNDSIVN